MAGTYRAPVWPASPNPATVARRLRVLRRWHAAHQRRNAAIARMLPREPYKPTPPGFANFWNPDVDVEA